MANDQPSNADTVILVIFTLLMLLGFLFVYVIIPLLVFAAMLAIVVLIVAGIVFYIRSHAWLPGGFLMTLLYLLMCAFGGATIHFMHIASFSPTGNGPAFITGLLFVLTVVFIALCRPVVRRKNAEALAEEQAQRQQEQRLEWERQEQQKAVKARKKEEARQEDARRLLQEADEAAEREEEWRRKEAAEQEAERRSRFRTLQARYGDAYLSWRTKDEELSRYAKEHRDELLHPERSRKIVRDYEAFHADDPDFTEWFQTTHPDLYDRADPVFFYRTRAIAESLLREEPKLPRPKLSPEERQAKFERYRARGLERDRVQAEDRMAAVRQKLGLLQQFRDDLDAYDLEEDERDRLIKEFEDDLFAQTEENFDGNFKQV